MCKKLIAMFFVFMTCVITSPASARILTLNECISKVFEAAWDRFYEGDVTTSQLTSFCNTLGNKYSWTSSQKNRCVIGVGDFIDEAQAVVGNDEGRWWDAVYKFEGVDSICEICPSGNYYDGIDCLPCEYGYIDYGFGNDRIFYGNEDDYCVLCTKGTYWVYDDVDGSATCESCEPGQYSNTEGATECELCPNGTYTEGWGNASCKTCPMSNGIQLTSYCGWYEDADACDSINSCYIPKDAKNQDEIGTFRFVNNCYYGQ